MRVIAPAGRRWVIALLAGCCVVLGAAAVVGEDLLPGQRPAPVPQGRPLSAEEADRLASMRQHNWRDARAGVRATIGSGPAAVHLTGWVDWQRPMVYLARSGQTPGVVTELVQAVPGLVATRPAPAGDGAPSPGPSADASPEVVDPHPQPPREPPPTGWRLRQPGADGAAGAPDAPGTIDALAVLLLTSTAEEPDAAALLADSEARWLRPDRTSGYEVDVLLGPAVPPASPPAGPPAPGRDPGTSLAAMGGAVQYWLDDQARLHRLEALLAPGTPVRVDLDRDDHTAPEVLDVLGGAAIDPRPVTDRQARELADLRQRNQATGGGEVRVVVPAEHGGPAVRAAGWLDWRRRTAYLVTYQGDHPDGLLWADGAGMGTHTDPPADSGLPPVPAPPADRWQRTPWEDRGDAQGGYDLDLLLNEALSLAGWQRDDVAHLRRTAVQLRTDELGGAPVTVYEIPREIESEVEPGEARLRYWVDDASGGLRRLEIRTRSGGFGQLDLDPGPVPAF